jgi:hypothetical protein
VADLAQAGVEPAELVRRASTALDHLQFADTGGSLMSFDELPSRRAD